MESLSKFFDSVLDGTADLVVVHEETTSKETTSSEDDIGNQQTQAPLEPEVMVPQAEDEQVVLEAAAQKKSTETSTVAEPEGTSSAPATSPSADPAERPTAEL